MRRGSICALLAAGAVLAGCAGQRVPVDGPVCRGFPGLGVEAPAEDSVAEAAGTPDPDLTRDIAERLAPLLRGRRMTEAETETEGFDLEILAITTGGQDGAFASGFLYGWEDRPTFGAVTGASAGGLIAPVAFAGPAFDEKLRLFRGIGEGDVVQKRPLFGLLSDGVYATDRLAARVEATYDAPLVEAIRRRPGVLLIGATDLATSRFTRLDVQAMLERTPETATARKCLAAAAMATSAIPAVFPPRPVNRILYSDAGVRQHVFLEGVEDALVRLGVADVARVRVTLLINHDLTYAGSPVPRTLLPLALRNVDIVGDEGMRASILRAVSLAERRHWAVRGVAIPTGFDAGEGCRDDGLFTACYNRALFDRAARMAAAGSGWMEAGMLRDRVETGAWSP